MAIADGDTASMDDEYGTLSVWSHAVHITDPRGLASDTSAAPEHERPDQKGRTRRLSFMER